MDHQVQIRLGMEPLGERWWDPHDRLALVDQERLSGSHRREFLEVEHREAFAQQLQPPVHSGVDLQHSVAREGAKAVVDTGRMRVSEGFRELGARRGHAPLVDMVSDGAQNGLLALVDRGWQHFFPRPLDIRVVRSNNWSD